ncbi:hypothetical protein [Nocardia huaxiensis]|uniref:Uncharacterized protein n=1 Tax=Nocardia huaxiensis TaxID=2755382 RepID=A0A7D6VHS9_9NOCA|nr:hypothetical protein [Nocardia huaxiensis]QLY33115.1 hypothetical protein H0264_13560 [Nocardia huaxiensis]UFS93114.1 hypothetical protein LPY97_19800 [Nocardia huaxiensis]
MPHTVETATAYVITELEAKGTATRFDFDVPGIVSATHNLTETWDFHAVDRTRFWNIAAAFLRG